MEELIALLRKAREDKKMTLEEISRQTKIQLRYLKSMENNDFSCFAGEVYLKGAIINYAGLVGLDPKEVMDLYYRLKNGSVPAEDTAQPANRNAEKIDPARPIHAASGRPPRVRERQGPTLTAGVIIVVLALIAAGVWFSRNYEWPGIGRAPAQPDQNAPQENGLPPDEDDASEPEPVPEMTKVTVSAAETVFSVRGTEQIEMILRFEGPCWVQLSVDNSEPFYPRTFTADEIYTATAGRIIRLRMGNPGDVRITVNGIVLTENRDMENPHNFQFSLE